MTPVFPSTESRPGRDDDLLSLYLAGKLDAAAAARIEQWMRRHPGSWETVEQFVSGAAGMDLQPPDMTRVLRALELRMDADDGAAIGVSDRDENDVVSRGTEIPESTIVRSSPANTSVYGAEMSKTARLKTGSHLQGLRVRRQRWFAFGVAALTVAVVFGGWMNNLLTSRNEAATSMSTYTTPNGQRSSITLPDGSTVVLNVASRLEVPTSYNGRDRTVRLQGEAYFDVVSDNKRPFVVVTPRSATRVLGTTFVVREYQADTVTTVAVKTGEVAVQKVLVSSQQQVKINRDGMARLAPATNDFTSFTSGVLSLQKVPLSEAIVDLGRWYDVEIRIDDAALETQQITGKFSMGSPNDLVGILQMTFDIRVVREGRVLTLYSK